MQTAFMTRNSTPSPPTPVASSMSENASTRSSPARLKTSVMSARIAIFCSSEVLPATSSGWLLIDAPCACVAALYATTSPALNARSSSVIQASPDPSSDLSTGCTRSSPKLNTFSPSSAALPMSNAHPCCSSAERSARST